MRLDGGQQGGYAKPATRRQGGYAGPLSRRQDSYDHKEAGPTLVALRVRTEKLGQARTMITVRG